MDVLETASVYGDIKSQQITISKGAHISGKITTGSSSIKNSIKQKIIAKNDEEKK